MKILPQTFYVLHSFVIYVSSKQEANIFSKMN